MHPPTPSTKNPGFIIRTLLACFLAATLSDALAQTGISQIHASYEETGDAHSYTLTNGNTYSFGNTPTVGEGHDLVLENFVINVGEGNETFDTIRLADRINIVRIDNNNITGNKQLVFFEQISETGGNYIMRPGYVNTMEEALLSNVINRGADNVFANTGGTNLNNIERIDFIFENGLIVPSDVSGEGFTVMDRGVTTALKSPPLPASTATETPQVLAEL